MGDYEEVFGVGADFDAIIDGFNRQADKDGDDHANYKIQYTDHACLKAHFHNSEGQLFLANWAEVEHFDGAWTGAFTRKREGSGFLVSVRAQDLAPWRHPGRVVIVGSEDEAEEISVRLNASVFECVGRVQSFIAKPNFLEDYEEEKNDQLRREASYTEFKLRRMANATDPKDLFMLVADGSDVVVYGRGVRIVTELACNFIGWTRTDGFVSIISREKFSFFAKAI